MRVLVVAATIIVAIVAIVAAGLVGLWLLVGGNVAGWVTSFVVILAGFFVAELLGLEHVFSRFTKRGQWIVIGIAVAVAAGGSAGYLLFPGTASWYLFPLLALPLLLILSWLRSADESSSGPIDLGDGPWTAP